MANFPTRSEGELVLPSGEKVWIKTLNSNQKTRTQTAAELAGRIAAAPVRKGGKGYAATLQEIKSMTPHEQALLVAQQKLLSGDFASRAEEEFAEPVYPEREKADDDPAWLKKLDKYTKSQKDVEEKREAKCKELYEATYNEALAFTDKQRVDECYSQVVSKEFSKGFSDCYNLHVIYFATRTVEDHAEFYFGNDVDEGVRKVEDLDDEVRRAIIVKYNELDTVRASEIPT